jgi:predicted transcriptional regulator
VTRRPNLPALGALELAVLEHLWQAGEADVVEAHEAVGRARGITPNTVGSALERLHRKGLASRRKVSHAYRYAPRLGRDELVARRVLDAAGDLQALTEVGLLAAFVDLVADSDAEALDRLEALIAAKRGGGDRA